MSEQLKLFLKLKKKKAEIERAEKKAQDENAFNEKIKKRIKINLIKPDIFKKKRDNIGAFITVEPNPFEKGLVQEIEEIPISRRETEKKNEEENAEENVNQQKEEEKPPAEGGGAENLEENPNQQQPENKEENNVIQNSEGKSRMRRVSKLQRRSRR